MRVLPSAKISCLGSSLSGGLTTSRPFVCDCVCAADDCWGGQRTASGQYAWDPIRFPSGMPALAKFVQSHGLELGLYMAAGNQTCNAAAAKDTPGASAVPGSLGMYAEDAKTLASWGVRYVKLDWCGYFPPLAKGDPAEMLLKPQLFGEFSRALNATGVPIYFSGSSALCNWENTHSPPDFAGCSWAPLSLNSWRIGEQASLSLCVLLPWA